jgi:hypothetical protein
MNKTYMPHQPLNKNEPIASQACSIPSRYQTFVVDNSDRKGFNSGTRRFHETELNDTPGPGHYNPSNHEIKKALLARYKCAKNYAKKPKVKSKSANANYTHRRRSGSVNEDLSLHSSFDRNNQIYDETLTASKFQTPGPNNYNIAKPLLDRKDFHRAHSSSFQSVRRNTNLFSTPAPNHYDPKSSIGMSISSPFRSNTLRCNETMNAAGIMASTNTKSTNKNNIPREKRVPSPTHYLIRDSVTKQNDRAPTSCFKSTTNRSEICYKTTKGAFYKDTSETSNKNPGPGSYGQISSWGKLCQEHSLKNMQKKGHYLAISAPAIPLPPNKPNPGPGHYELVDYSGPMKKDRGSSMFSSNTDRWHKELRNVYISKQAPGPASYNPKGIPKQSFIFNSDSRWIS